MSDVPKWLTDLGDDDLQFVRRFVLASGSLKELAEFYGVSYPTLRGRLDRLIALIKASDAAGDADPFERKVRLLVADGKLTAGLAKELLAAHRAAAKKPNP